MKPFISLVCVSLLAIAMIPDAYAFRGGGGAAFHGGGGGFHGGGAAFRGGGYRGAAVAGGYRGGYGGYRGGYYGGGYRGGYGGYGGAYYGGGGLLAGAALGSVVGAAASSAYYPYGGQAYCGYYPYPPC